MHRLFDTDDDEDEDLFENLNNVKNYIMLLQLMIDASGSASDRQEELQYYSDNLARIDSLKSFIDDEGEGLLSEALEFFLIPCPRAEAILRYIVDHENVEFCHDNVVEAAAKSEYVFFKLVEAGANVHRRSWMVEFTALHNATLYKHKNIVKYLLDQNVDVNCRNRYSFTPLHYALGTEDNSDIVELLIQNEAIYVVNSEGLTPLEHGINLKQVNNVSSVLNSKLTDNIITYDLLKKMFSCFCQLYSGRSEAVQNDYHDFFKLLYEKLVTAFIDNHDNTTESSLLSIYLNNNVFQSKQWADALTVILTSEIASSLLEEWFSFEPQSIYALLIPKLIRVNVDQKEDRCKLFNCLLSLKMNPNLKDMALILSHYRFDEEFRLLSYHLREDSLKINYNRENPVEYLACVFCGLEDDLDYNAIFGQELPEEFYNYIKQYFTPALSNCSSRNGEMDKPNILSLREISRNSARKFINKICKILSPKDFYFAVQSMRIPLKCKNFILLLSTIDEFLN